MSQQRRKMHKRGQVHFFELIVTPKYQLASLAVTTLLLILIALHPFSTYEFLEPTPHLLSVTPKQVNEWGGNATEVTVGLHIINFPEFDILHNNFIIDGIIWFEFDPALVSLETVEKFSFEKGDILKKTISDNKVINGRFFVEYNITVKFTTNLSFQFFPLDDHRIFLTLTNKFVSPHELIYQAYVSGFTMSEGVFIHGWRMVKKNVVAGYSESYLDENDPKKVVLNPKVVFSIDFTRTGFQQIFLIFLPLFLMFFITIFSFTLDPIADRSLILSLSLAGITAILSYRFVIQGMSPQVGYFLLSDHIFTMFLVFVMVAFLVNVILMSRKKEPISFLMLRGVVYLLFHVTLIIVWYYLLYIWNVN